MTHRSGNLDDMWITVDGLTMYARVSVDPDVPATPPIVFVHGFIISSRYMVPVAQHLAPYFHLYAPDMPGFGNSGEPGYVLSVPELADSLARWMDVVGLERAVLLGNSFGCQVVAKLAQRHPERVHRAVLVGPTVDPERRTIVQQAVGLIRNSRHERPSFVFVHIPDYRKAGLRRIVRMIDYVLEDRIEASLPHVRAPTLVVRGSKDPIVVQGWVERVVDLLPMGRLVVIPGAAHALNYSAPRRLACVVRAFLAGEEQGWM